MAEWSICTDRFGTPIGWTADGANRHDSILLEPTLDDAAERDLLADVETLWVDRGYDSNVARERVADRDINDAVIAKKRKRGSAPGPVKNQPMGLRWPVERTWLSNYGGLRRKNDRRTIHRLTQLPFLSHPAHRQAHRLAKPPVTGTAAYPLSL